VRLLGPMIVGGVVVGTYAEMGPILMVMRRLECLCRALVQTLCLLGIFDKESTF
jgi:hypothetical protein